MEIPKYPKQKQKKNTFKSILLEKERKNHCHFKDIRQQIFNVTTPFNVIAFMLIAVGIFCVKWEKIFQTSQITIFIQENSPKNQTNAHYHV